MIQGQQTGIGQELQRRRRQYGIIAVGIILAVMIAVGIAGAIQYHQETKTPQATPADSDPGAITDLENAAPIRIGVATAPHIVTLWEDARCAHCATVELKIGSTLTQAIRNGQARLELYPLQIIDQGSARAAAAQGCAASFGRALNYHSGIWENRHSRWTTEQLKELAYLTGGDHGGDIAACIDSEKYEQWAKSLDSAANTAGIEGTPTLIVDGTRIDLATLDTTSFKEKLR